MARAISVCQWAWWSPHLPLTSPSLPVVLVSCVDTGRKVNGEENFCAYRFNEFSDCACPRAVVLKLKCTKKPSWEHVETVSETPLLEILILQIWAGAMGVYIVGVLMWWQAAGQRAILWEPLLWKRTRRWGWHHSSSIIWFQCALSVSHLPKTPICHLHYLGSSVSEELSRL